MHFSYDDSDKAEPVDTARNHITTYDVESEHGKPRNVGFDNCGGYHWNMSDNEFHDAEEFYENFQELGSSLSAQVSIDSHTNRGDLEERVMLKRWFDEPVKDGPYHFSHHLGGSSLTLAESIPECAGY